MLKSALVLVAVFAAQCRCSTLSGAVSDLFGHGIAGANVVLTGSDSRVQVATTHTDASGAYSFPSLRQGTFNIDITSPGFITGRVRNVHVNNSGAVVPSFALEVGKGCGAIPIPQYLLLKDDRSSTRISGIILDHASNKPIANATFELTCKGHRHCETGTSDKSGHYALSGAPGRVSLRMRRRGYYEEEYGPYNLQGGFETVYYPIFLDRCGTRGCLPSLKPIARCE